MKPKPPGAGKESLGIIDAPRLFTELDLSRARTFLDLGCGPGKYSMEVLQHLPQGARVIAVDLWEEGLRSLQEALKARAISRISPVLADIGRGIPLKKCTVDVCLVANVLHDLAVSHKEKVALKEMARILKPGSTLAIIEFKKIPGPPGPPLDIRIGPGELQDMVEPYGFKKVKVTSIGPYSYLAIFNRRAW